MKNLKINLDYIVWSILALVASAMPFVIGGLILTLVK